MSCKYKSQTLLFCSGLFSFSIFRGKNLEMDRRGTESGREVMKELKSRQSSIISLQIFIQETLTELTALADEARSAGALSADVVAICAVLTAAHLGALGTIETWRTTCKGKRPVNFLLASSAHYTEIIQSPVLCTGGFCATGFNLMRGSTLPADCVARKPVQSSPVQSASKHQQTETHNSWGSTWQHMKKLAGGKRLLRFHFSNSKSKSWCTRSDRHRKIKSV